MGVGHLELDVHSTLDERVVVIHDDTLDRTTTGSGPVASQSWAALTTLDAGSWFGERFAAERIPACADVLERYRGRAHLHIEIKGRSAHLVEQTADLVRAGGMVEGVTITSFQKARLEETRAYAPELPTGWLVGEASDAIVAEARAGVATEAAMHRVVQAGADGMTVNFPDKLIAYLTSTPSPIRSGAAT